MARSGEDNPQIQAALAQREKAQIDLMHARVTAPVDGVVTNTVLSVGQFVGAGQHVATIIDTASAWIVAQIPENALGRMKPGDLVDIVLDVAPGRIFQGQVESTGSGVEQVVAAGSAGRSAIAGEPARLAARRAAHSGAHRIRGARPRGCHPVRCARERHDLHADAGFVEPFARAWMWTVAYVRFAF